MTIFSRMARAACRFAGHPVTFFAAVILVILWGATGPYFGYSDTWQLIINTGTTILTFLMVFLLQNGQNRDMCAIHLKLDELIRAVKEARNSVMDLENLDDAQLAKLLVEYRNLAGREPVSNGHLQTVGSDTASATMHGRVKSKGFRE